MNEMLALRRSLIDPDYHRAFDALMASLNGSDLYNGILNGTAKVETGVFYLKKAFSTSDNKPFLDSTLDRTKGQTNFQRGKFPFEFVGAFSNANLAYAYNSASGKEADSVYTNNWYESQTADAATVSATVIPQDKIRIPSWLLNTELSFKVGDAAILDRHPASAFFRQGKYASEKQVHSGLHIENSMKLGVPVITNGKNTPELEFFFPAGTTISNYFYFEFSIYGAWVRGSR